jgi:pyruvate kinase
MESVKDATLSGLKDELQALRSDLGAVQTELLRLWEPTLLRASWLPSARNLAAYVGLRRIDLRDLQARLAPLGLSSLGRCEGHVEATLEAVSLALDAYLGRPADPQSRQRVQESMESHRNHLDQNTEELLGPTPGHRRTRIMVTLPSEAAKDPALVRDWLARGMDCARINMAHDGPEAWEAMVQHVRRAESVTGRRCRVLMDLGGQKLRIGDLTVAAPAVHLKVKRDSRGQVIQAAGAVLDASGARGRQSGRDGQGRRTAARIPVDPAWLRGLRVGDSVTFSDLLGKHRSLEVIAAESQESFQVRCWTNAFLEPGMVLEHRPSGRKKVRRCPVGTIDSQPAKIVVFEGDFLRLTGPGDPGEPASFDEMGELLCCAHIPCENAEVFRFLRPGERVFMDDGSVEAEILQAGTEEALLRITRARLEGEKLRSEKGINFPDSALGLSALSSEDLDHLPLVARLADLVGFSFVQETEDLDHLMSELAQHSDRPIPILAKIETARAVRNLPHLIARGAGQRSLGVMIARGDLAVEIGYERLAEIQEELLWLCEAAHVPVVWATQVLENLLKRGVPTRAEMTDAAMSMRAECVMLNKGAHIPEALALLDGLEDRMQAHQEKKRAMLRALHW